MAMFFILVMDKYKDDPGQWMYSASSISKAQLLALRCYEDPPRCLPRDNYVSVCESRVSMRPCAGGEPEGGTVHGLNPR